MLPPGYHRPNRQSLSPVEDRLPAAEPDIVEGWRMVRPEGSDPDPAKGSQGEDLAGSPVLQPWTHRAERIRSGDP